MSCFFYDDCNERKSSWCNTNHVADKCGHAEKAFNNKCIKLYLHYIKKLNEEEKKLENMETKLYNISYLF